jgi:hypothetical protein
MTAHLFLPIAFVKFWYLDAPIALGHYFSSLNTAFLHFVSLPLFLRTFFKPLKNEYREGLVGFSIGMGIAVKTMLIGVDLVVFFLLLAVEVLSVCLFLLLPIITILLLFL